MKEKRVEIRVKQRSDPDVYEFLEECDNMAGFIKTLLRLYVKGNMKVDMSSQLPHKNSNHLEKEQEKHTEKKRLPKQLMSAISSKDF